MIVSELMQKLENASPNATVRVVVPNAKEWADEGDPSEGASVDIRAMCVYDDKVVYLVAPS